MSITESNPELENLLQYLKRNRGFDFTGYKRTSLTRRIRKRMQEIGVEDYGDYLDYLEVHPDEYIDLFNTILINVTAFFRDKEAWDYIAQEIIPRIIGSKYTSRRVRVWCAGCATGQETYTIAILLAEALGMEKYMTRVKVFATDLDTDALNYARQGSYTAKEVNGVPPELLEKYFERVNNRYVVEKELRRAVIFGRHNLVQDAPISKIDLLMCRNTLMYFNTEAQNKILDRFYFALNDGGYLLLGKAEMLLSRHSAFMPMDLGQRVFTKAPNGAMRDMLSVAQPNSLEPPREIVDQNRIYQAAFDINLLAEVVVDINGIVVLVNEEARNLFNISTRDLGRPLQDLEISYRPVELRSRIEQVRTNRRSVSVKDIQWLTPERETKQLEVQMMPLVDSDSDILLGVKIIFEDVTRFTNLQQQLLQANQELETAYEELQSTNEELETTNEELQSTVEELETTNEELQSTNEELETMNEELQSTNEELHSINQELRLRSQELNRVNVFFSSILTNLRSGVVVLNTDLLIQIWNSKAEDLWGVRADEVFMQHFMSLDIGLPLEPIRQLVRSIVSGESEYRELVLNATNRRGKAILCEVICTPLVDLGGEIQGVILLMEERDPVVE